MFFSRDHGKNPDGLTFDEFVEKYSDIKHIAYLCWYCGCYPEQLKEEIKILLEETDRFYFLDDKANPEPALSGEYYYPVRLAAMFDLDNLPDDKEFLDALKDNEED